MKKLVVLLVVFMSLSVKADTRVLGVQSTPDGYEYTFKSSVGGAYYHDAYGLDCAAFYTQTPVAEVGNFVISFGAILPAVADDVERTRPEFSFTYGHGQWEIGVYSAVSPYGAYGVMFGMRL